MRFQWVNDTSRRIPCEVAMVGCFEATITEGGPMTIGVRVFVGTFAGRVVAISPTFAECENQIQKAGVAEVLRAATMLRGGS